MADPATGAAFPPAHELLDAVPAAVAVVAADGTIVLVNAAFEALTGFDRGELVGGAVDDLVPAHQREVHERHRQMFLAHPSSRPMGTGLDIACGRKNGGPFAADISLSPLATADGQFVVCTVRDETERRATEAALTHRALHDPLTGLANRVLLVDRFDLALRRADRRGGDVAVLFLDLDAFKSVNDRYGHAAGDDVLVAIAKRMATSVRPGDTVARVGGDEFVVVAEDVGGREGALELARRLLAAVSAPLPAPGDGSPLSITLSAGIALAGPGLGVLELLSAADEALYRSKQHGRNRAEVAVLPTRPAPLGAED